MRWQPRQRSMRRGPDGDVCGCGACVSDPDSGASDEAWTVACGVVVHETVESATVVCAVAVRWTPS